MSLPALRIDHLSSWASLQDRGRSTGRCYGMPPGGCMDLTAAAWANQLLSNPPNAALVEFHAGTATLTALHDIVIALTGATTPASRLRPHGSRVPTTEPLRLWQTHPLQAGDRIEWTNPTSGVWLYLGIQGGFSGPTAFGSRSVLPRAGWGTRLTPGHVLARATRPKPTSPSKVGRRWIVPSAIPNYLSPLTLRVWPGPQWDDLNHVVTAFFQQTWEISRQCDRVGYRLSGESLPGPFHEGLSEPVLVGTIQIPPSGQPIVTLVDGPTVGGYPKLGVLDPSDLPAFVQARPGTRVQFEPAPGSSQAPRHETAYP